MPRNNIGALFGLFFFGLPLIEIALFIVVGRQIGVLPTILLTILTSITGAALARIEGFATLRAVDASLKQGEPPVRDMLGGALVAMGAMLLAVPGFFTDFLGILLLIRPIRLWFAGWLAGYLRVSTGAGRRNAGPRVIEVTAVEVDPDERG